MDSNKNDDAVHPTLTFERMKERIQAIQDGDVDAIREWTEDRDVCHSPLAREALRSLLHEIDRLRAETAASIQDVAVDSPPRRSFLEELRARARRYGWSGDYTEVSSFVRALYMEADAPIEDADLEPIDDEEERA